MSLVRVHRDPRAGIASKPLSAAVMIRNIQSIGQIGYVGPGAGLGLLGALVGLVVAGFSALSFIIWWPLRQLLRKRQGQSTGTPDEMDGQAGRSDR